MRAPAPAMKRSAEIPRHSPKFKTRPSEILSHCNNILADTNFSKSIPHKTYISSKLSDLFEKKLTAGLLVDSLEKKLVSCFSFHFSSLKRFRNYFKSLESRGVLRVDNVVALEWLKKHPSFAVQPFIGLAYFRQLICTRAHSRKISNGWLPNFVLYSSVSRSASPFTLHFGAYP